MDIDLKDYIPWIGGAVFALVALHALYLTWRSRRARRAEAAAEQEQADADTLPPVLAKPLNEPLGDRDPLARPFVPPNPRPPAAAAPALRANVGEPAASGAAEAEPPRIVIPGKRTEPTVPRDQRGPQPKKEPAAARSAAAAGRAPTPAAPGRAASPAASPRAASPANAGPAPPPSAPRQAPSPSRTPSPDDPVMVMWVAAKPGASMDGANLLRCMQARGLEHDNGVFYKFDPTTKGEWFMVANGIEPGTFDADNMGALATPRIVLLLRLAAVRNVTEAFDDMLDFAQDVANEFGGDIQDGNHVVLNVQAIDKYRQRIREFKRTSRG